jgi:hypothetical protein
MSFWQEFFEPTYFFCSFFLGMLIVYISTPTPEIILRYPTPHNAGKVVYKDHADICYVYDSKEVSCSNKAIDTPLQLAKHSENIEHSI